MILTKLINKTNAKIYLITLPWIGGVRGLGAMQGIIIINPETGEADKSRTSRIHQYALEHG